MRVKQERLVVTFYTTAAAIAVEKRALARGVPGRLIPVPREITADCGIAWSAPPEAREDVERLLAEEKIEAQELRVMML